MTSIEKTLSKIRPKLRHVSPTTFWFSAGFGVFNVLVGLGLFNAKILTVLKVAGVIPLKVWGVIFVVHGLLMIYSLAINNWTLSRSLNSVGIGIKTMWWLELLNEFIYGTTRSPFLLIIWSLLLFFQIIVFIYFTPRVRDVK